ncbi:MAG: 4Fe-4S binding protein [Maribacter sp.]|uniref:ATP-binding protein n=1 Tax=Maribacter sp. TaxID=1897614 RepID=UPI003C719B9A
MREITIVSGKGGTGKTSLTAAIASVAEKAVFCDNDVDAADLHLILQPQILEVYRFSSGWKAVIDEMECTNCGICMDHCRFDAIAYNSDGQLVIDPYQCEGCRLCERICPEHAISSSQNNNNQWFVSHTRFGELVHAQMGPGEENSGKLVSQIRKKAMEIAKNTQAEYIINDGPPGIGCATISSISGTDAVLLIIEPTISGFKDAQRLIDLIGIFNIATYAVINKYDLHLALTTIIEDYLKSRKISLLAKIPFDIEMVTSMTQGKTIIEYNPTSPIAIQIRDVWNKIKTSQETTVDATWLTTDSDVK